MKEVKNNYYTRPWMSWAALSPVQCTSRNALRCASRQCIMMHFTNLISNEEHFTALIVFQFTAQKSGVHINFLLQCNYTAQWKNTARHSSEKNTARHFSVKHCKTLHPVSLKKRLPQFRFTPHNSIAHQCKQSLMPHKLGTTLICSPDHETADFIIIWFLLNKLFHLDKYLLGQFDGTFDLVFMRNVIIGWLASSVLSWWRWLDELVGQESRSGRNNRRMRSRRSRYMREYNYAGLIWWCWWQQWWCW